MINVFGLLFVKTNEETPQHKLHKYFGLDSNLQPLALCFCHVEGNSIPFCEGTEGLLVSKRRVQLPNKNGGHNGRAAKICAFENDSNTIQGHSPRSERELAISLLLWETVESLIPKYFNKVSCWKTKNVQKLSQLKKNLLFSCAYRG